MEWLNYMEALGGQAAIAIDNVQMFDSMQQSNQELLHAYDATITGWSHAMDLRDKETEGQTLRSDRPYRPSWTVAQVREHIAERSGPHFDPRVVEAFFSFIDESPDLQ